MAKNLTIHPAGSITSSGASNDSALVMCHGSFVKRVFDLVQHIRAGATPQYIATLAEEISPYSTALLAQAKTNEDLNRWHARQTATEADNESIPLQASSSEVLIANKEQVAANDAVFEELHEIRNRLDRPIPVVFAPEEETIPEDLPDFDKDGFWEPQEKFAERTQYGVGTLQKHREAKEKPRWFKFNGSAIGKTNGGKIGHYIKKIQDTPVPLYEYFVFNDSEKTRLLNNPRPKNKQ
ncbi:MAG: hypothetical protein LBI05_03560 [Planctomycetaceae bacterium]|nr:hypothetical protein [Planctomycetaceae bacterium]